MSRTTRRSLITLIILSIAAVSIWYLNRPKPIEIGAEKAELGLVEETVANTRAGTVKACRRARLAPGIGGQIGVLDIHEGDHVKQGDLLLALWNKDLLAQIALYEAEADAAQATARSTCLQAEVALREANRLSKLRRSGAVSEESVDKAITEAKAKEAACESANATARVSTAHSDVVRAELERTQLIAPFDGVVAEINGELNEYVTPSPPGIPTLPAVDLIDNSCFYVTAPIDEVDAPKIAVDQTARVSLDAFGDKRFPGTVRRIASYVLDLEKQARTVEVEVEFSDKKDIEQLLAGYSADVEIILEERKNTLRIPSEALIDESRVYVYLADAGELEERKVTTGIANWDYTEIVSGVEAGEWVVTTVDKEGIVDGALATLEAGGK